MPVVLRIRTGKGATVELLATLASLIPPRADAATRACVR